MSHWHTIVMFPIERQTLNQEVTHHPELQLRLNNHPADEFELKLAEIASYCDVVLDGTYTQQDLNNICKILANRLYSMRKAIEPHIEVIRDPSIVPLMKAEE